MQSFLATSVLGDLSGCERMRVSCVRIVCTATSVTSPLLFKPNIQSEERSQSKTFLGAPGRPEQQTWQHRCDVVTAESPLRKQQNQPEAQRKRKEPLQMQRDKIVNGDHNRNRAKQIGEPCRGGKGNSNNWGSGTCGQQG
jgi:hypothetical protein